MNGISRRTLLKRLVLGALAGALPAPLRRSLASDPTPDLAVRLVACLSNPASARLLGERYLAGQPHEADAALLTADIAGDSRVLRAVAAADQASLRLLLAEQQRHDFAARRTANVEGWMLSRTEARLCALAALVHGRA